MLDSLKSVFKGKSTKQLSDVFHKEKETLERKKCMNCLKNVKIEYLKCPFCGSVKFNTD